MLRASSLNQLQAEIKIIEPEEEPHTSGASVRHCKLKNTGSDTPKYLLG